MFIEPLLLIPSSDYIDNWYHPEIKELTKDLLETEFGKLRGNLVRFDIIFSKERIIHIISITDDIGMKDVMSEEGLKDYSDRLATLLNEAVWLPGGTQFIKSEYGHIVDRMFPMYVENYAIGVSNDISIVTDGTDWWFDS